MLNFKKKKKKTNKNREDPFHAQKPTRKVNIWYYQCHPQYTGLMKSILSFRGHLPETDTVPCDIVNTFLMFLSPTACCSCLSCHQAKTATALGEAWCYPVRNKSLPCHPQPDPRTCSDLIALLRDTTSPGWQWFYLELAKFLCSLFTLPDKSKWSLNECEWEGESSSKEGRQ